jgi:hypothetical protein
MTVPSHRPCRWSTSASTRFDLGGSGWGGAAGRAAIGDRERRSARSRRSHECDRARSGMREGTPRHTAAPHVLASDRPVALATRGSLCGRIHARRMPVRSVTGSGGPTQSRRHHLEPLWSRRRNRHAQHRRGVPHRVVRHVEACVLNHPIGRHTAAGAGVYEDANLVDVSRLNAQRRRCAITPTPPADKESHSPRVVPLGRGPPRQLEPAGAAHSSSPSRPTDVPFGARRDSDVAVVR